PADEITLLDVSRAVDGELITLRGAVPGDLDYPGAASGLPDVWRRVEADVASVLRATTVASLLSAGAGRRPVREEPAGQAPSEDEPAREEAPLRKEPVGRGAA